VNKNIFNDGVGYLDAIIPAFLQPWLTMPYKQNEGSRHKSVKYRYKVINWRGDNNGLRERGDFVNFLLAG
jgi:hypothetical protein